MSVERTIALDSRLDPMVGFYNTERGCKNDVSCRVLHGGVAHALMEEIDFSQIDERSIRVSVNKDHPKSAWIGFGQIADLDLQRAIERKVALHFPQLSVEGFVLESRFIVYVSFEQDREEQVKVKNALFAAAQRIRRAIEDWEAMLGHNAGSAKSDMEPERDRNMWRLAARCTVLHDSHWALLSEAERKALQSHFQFMRRLGYGNFGASDGFGHEPTLARFQVICPVIAQHGFDLNGPGVE